MSAEYHMHLSRLASLLGGYHYRYGSEVQLHQALSTVLTDAGFEHEREVALDARNRADFWLEGIVIEVKVDGSSPPHSGSASATWPFRRSTLCCSPALNAGPIPPWPNDRSWRASRSTLSG